MLRVSATVKLATAPEEVWETLREFANLAEWHPDVASCELEGEGVGGFRVLSFADDASSSDSATPATARDLLERIGDGSYAYVAVETTLPVTSWRSTLNLYLTAADAAAATSCVVQWSGEFEPDGVPEGDAVLAVLEFYRRGLQYLEHVFGAAS